MHYVALFINYPFTRLHKTIPLHNGLEINIIYSFLFDLH